MLEEGGNTHPPCAVALPFQIEMRVRLKSLVCLGGSCCFGRFRLILSLSPSNRGEWCEQEHDSEF